MPIFSHLKMLSVAVRNVVGATLLLQLCACSTFPTTLATSASQATKALGAPESFDVSNIQGIDWVATQLDGVPKLSEPRPTLRWNTPDQVSGSGGCNRFSGKVVMAGAEVRFGPLASTRMMCIASPQGQEDKYFRALEAARTIKRDGDALLLLDGAGQPLVRFAKGGV